MFFGRSTGEKWFFSSESMKVRIEKNRIPKNIISLILCPLQQISLDLDIEPEKSKQMTLNFLVWKTSGLDTIIQEWDNLTYDSEQSNLHSCIICLLLLVLFIPVLCQQVPVWLQIFLYPLKLSVYLGSWTWIQWHKKECDKNYEIIVLGSAKGERHWFWLLMHWVYVSAVKLQAPWGQELGIIHLWICEPSTVSWPLVDIQKMFIDWNWL